VEARGGARLSPGTFPDPPHALLPTHISKKSHSILFGSSLMDITVHNVIVSEGGGNCKQLVAREGTVVYEVSEVSFL